MNSINGPSNHSGVNASSQGKISTQSGPRLESSNKTSTLATDTLIFPNTTASEADVHFMTKKMPIEDNLIPELDQLLYTNASQIENSLKELENSETNKQAINAILEAETFSFELVYSKNLKVKKGLTFLKQVLPEEVIGQIPHIKRVEYLGGIIALGTAFLSTLELGSQGLSLIYKSKLLQQSRELLEQLKTNYNENSVSDAANLEKLKKWDIQLKLEEEQLSEERWNFALKSASKVAFFLNFPSEYLPKEWLIEQLHTAPHGLSQVMTGLELLILTLELKHAVKKADILQHWAESYQKWQDRHQPQFKITENDAKREQFNPSPSTFLSKKEHEKVLFKFIEEAKDLTQIRKYLKDFDIHLDSTLSSKEDLLVHLKNHVYSQELTEQYVKIQKKLENLNMLIHTSQNLLIKRKAIVEKKVLMLKPHFDTVKAKIYELKYTAFRRDIRQSLLEKLKDPYCTSEEIKAQFKQWGFFDTDRASQNQSLIQAFEKFQNFKAQKKDVEGISPEQKALKSAFTQWMISPANKSQFEHWFDKQPKEELLRSYIDHQETLEHTTKNALKQMVQQKHAIEGHLLNFQLNKTLIKFSTVCATITISIILALVGILTAPVAGAGFILLGISLGSFAINLGLLFASNYQINTYKPNSKRLSFSFKADMVWTKLGNSIQAYFHQAKEKKLLEVAKILYKLHLSNQEDVRASEEYKKALIDYKNAKKDFENSQEKVNHWRERLKRLETTFNKEAWKDFAQHASLQIGKASPGFVSSQAFDTLQAFQKALQACDFRLLSPETKTLLELQLGFNLEALQAQISKNPGAIKDNLREFFAMEESKFVAFIKYQRELANKGLLRSQPT